MNAFQRLRELQVKVYLIFLVFVWIGLFSAFIQKLIVVYNLVMHKTLSSCLHSNIILFMGMHEMHAL